MGHRGRAVLQQFYQKTFRKKRYQTNSETKANQNEKLEIISYSQKIKKEKRTTDITTNTKNLEERKY